jgi:aldose sugar dehydrogenase
MKSVIAWRLLPVLAALGASAVALVMASRAANAAGGTARLPDLVQQVPRDLVITRAGASPRAPYMLGFRSAVSNVGDGPLVIEGHRPGGQIGTMLADQVVDRDGAPKAIVPAIGRLRYVVSPDHRHWHLLGFDRYELRRARQRVAAVRDEKTGFCLGDRYVESGHVLRSAAAPAPVFTSRCGLGEPQLLGVSEGISVGYGDDYAANLEGQYLRLSGLPSGRYVLVHQVNADRRLRETDYRNDAASLLLDLRWRAAAPLVRILRRCPGTDRCDRPSASATAMATPTASAAPDVRTVATGLEIPWEIAFLPDRSALVTERPGRVRFLGRNGRLRRRPVARVAVSTQGEGGLLGIAVDPDFAHNRFVYLYYTTGAGMRLERWRFASGRLTRARSLLDGVRAGPIHDSGRIAFGPDGRLYVATGDAGDGRLAQQADSLNGKFLALTPAQYRGRGGTPEIVSRGHRNPQGLAWQPSTGRLIATEHGPTQGLDGPGGFDEINAIVPGGNYGWPVKFGFDQTGFDAPLRVYPQPLAPSGATFVTHGGSAWTGSFVFACLRGEELRRLTFRDGEIVADQALLQRRFGRLRTVVEGPGGDLYVLTSNRDGRGRPVAQDDRILRVTPPRS